MRSVYHLPVILSVGSLVGYNAHYEYGVDLIVFFCLFYYWSRRQYSGTSAGYYVTIGGLATEWNLVEVHHLYGVASITFSLSRSSTIGHIGSLLFVFQGGSLNYYTYYAVNGNGVAIEPFGGRGVLLLETVVVFRLYYKVVI